MAVCFSVDYIDPLTPTITITEDLSTPVDEDDYVKYFGLEAHTEGTDIMLSKCVVVFVNS